MTRRLKFCTILKLSLPGDWRERLESESVKRLAASGDILQPPAIRKADQSVIWGGDRLAALHARGAQEAECWEIDCDEETAEEMRLVENAHRRHDNRDELLDRLVILHQRRLEQQKQRDDQLPYAAYDNSERQPGRPKTTVGEAREAVAAAVGTTPEAVRAAQSRVAAETGPPSAQGKALGDASLVSLSPLGSATPGLDIAVALDGIDRLLTQAVTGITKLCKEHPELTDRFPLQDLKWELQRKVAPGLRAMKPIGVCGYCKGWPGELENCAACRGSNWLTSDQVKDIPPDLLVVGEGAGIYREGRFVTLAELDKARAKKSGPGTTAGKTPVVGQPPNRGQTGGTRSWPVRNTASGSEPEPARLGGRALSKRIDVRVVGEDGSEESWLGPWTDTK